MNCILSVSVQYSQVSKMTCFLHHLVAEVIWATVCQTSWASKSISSYLVVGWDLNAWVKNTDTEKNRHRKQLKKGKEIGRNLEN